MFKRVMNILTQAVLNATGSSFSKTLGVGTWNGILLTAKTGALHDSDTITITLRDAKGAKPICQSMTIADLRKISDLQYANPSSNNQMYIHIGCVALGGPDGAELDVLYNRSASGNAATIYATAVLFQEQYAHVTQYLKIVGDDIVNKDIQDLYVMNGASYPDATIEIGYVNGRSTFCTVQELIGASNVFGNSVAAITDVVLVYKNKGMLNEIDYVRVSDANVVFYYTSLLVDGSNIVKPLQEAVNFNAVKETKNAAKNPEKFRAIRNAVTANFAVKKTNPAVD